jgi:hypothetical protein
MQTPVIASALTKSTDADFIEASHSWLCNFARKILDFYQNKRSSSRREPIKFVVVPRPPVAHEQAIGGPLVPIVPAPWIGMQKNFSATFHRFPASRHWPPFDAAGRSGWKCRHRRKGDSHGTSKRGAIRPSGKAFQTAVAI